MTSTTTASLTRGVRGSGEGGGVYNRAAIDGARGMASSTFHKANTDDPPIVAMRDAPLA